MSVTRISLGSVVPTTLTLVVGLYFLFYLFPDRIIDEHGVWVLTPSAVHQAFSACVAVSELHVCASYIFDNIKRFSGLWPRIAICLLSCGVALFAYNANRKRSRSDL